MRGTCVWQLTQVGACRTRLVLPLEKPSGRPSQHRWCRRAARLTKPINSASSVPPPTPLPAGSKERFSLSVVRRLHHPAKQLVNWLDRPVLTWLRSALWRLAAQLAGREDERATKETDTHASSDLLKAAVASLDHGSAPEGAPRRVAMTARCPAGQSDPTPQARSPKRPRKAVISLLWCGREDSNLHALRR